jgi:hypothetical protein
VLSGNRPTHENGHEPLENAEKRNKKRKPLERRLSLGVGKLSGENYIRKTSTGATKKGRRSATAVRRVWPCSRELLFTASRDQRQQAGGMMNLTQTIANLGAMTAKLPPCCF